MAVTMRSMTTRHGGSPASPPVTGLGGARPFRACRARLAEHLGLEPAPETLAV
jgi:hypothetical protein